MVKQDVMLETVGLELRAARELHPAERLSGDEIADAMGWGRSSIAKIELGNLMPDGTRQRTNLSLYAYLCLVEKLERNMPGNHPALALLNHVRNSAKRK